MKGALLVAALLAADGAGRTPDPASPLFQRWLHNPRARTGAGLAALEDGDTALAAERFAAAARLAPADPLTRFNSGTGRLAAGEAAAAAAELVRAAELADGELAARALYNLGNAHAAGGDWRAAIEAYKAALRLEPEPLDAKVNLELALRQQARREEQEQQQGRQEQPEQQPEQQGRGPQPQGPEPDPAADEGQEKPQPATGTGKNVLPNFAEQPDMTAEQAAAILEAVENMEREQRRQAAQQRAREVPAGQEDW